MATIPVGAQAPDQYDEYYEDEYIPQDEPVFVGPDGETPPEHPTEVPIIPVFLADVWDSPIVQVLPELVAIGDSGEFVYYKGKSHCIVGKGGGGKTWFVLSSLLKVLSDDPQAVVMYVDYEDTIETCLKRLRQLGCTRDLASRFAYFRVTGSLMGFNKTAKAYRAFDEAYSPVIAIDSISKSMSAADFDENSNGDFNKWDTAVVEWATLRGCTVICIDHVGHKGGVGRGASTKVDRVTGASFRFETTAAWVRGSSGSFQLVTLKDRPGTHKEGEVAILGTVHVNDADELRIELEIAPEGVQATTSGFKPNTYMERISDLLDERATAMSAMDIYKEISGKTQFKKLGLEALIADGYVTRTIEGRSKLHTLVRPYLGEEDKPF